MAKVQVSVGLLAVSLALLIIYGADAAVVASSPDHTGFLPLDEATRGGGLGGGAVIMSIAAFIIARKEPSNIVTMLLFVNGGLIIAGMLALIGQGALASENAERAMSTIGSTIAMGAILVGLGGWKAATDKRLTGRKEQATR
jgi:hypothetical protein